MSPCFIHRFDASFHSRLEKGRVLSSGCDLLKCGKFGFGGPKVHLGQFDTLISARGGCRQAVEVLKNSFSYRGIELDGLDAGGFGTGSGSMGFSAGVVVRSAPGLDGHAARATAAEKQSSQQELLFPSRRSGLVGLRRLPCRPVDKRFVGVQVLDGTLTRNPEVGRVFEKVSDRRGEEGPVQSSSHKLGKRLVAVSGHSAKEHFTNHWGGNRIRFKPAVFSLAVSKRCGGCDVNTPGDRVGFGRLETFRLNFPLVFSDSKHDVSLHSSCRGSRVHLLTGGPEQVSASFDSFEQFKGVPEGAGKAVRLPYDKPVKFAGFDAFDAVKQYRSCVVTPGCVEFGGEQFDGMVLEGSPFADSLLLQLWGDQGFGAIANPRDTDISKKLAHRGVSIISSKGASYSATLKIGPAVRQNTQGRDDEGIVFTVANSLHPQPEDEAWHADPLITIPEAAEWADTTERELRSNIEAGNIRCLKIAGGRLSEKEVGEWYDLELPGPRTLKLKAEAEARVKEPKPKPRPDKLTHHWVYFMYGEQGDLLYVGITGKGMYRLMQHAETKEWWPQVHQVRIEHFASRADALAREDQAIALHLPPFNVKLPPGVQRPEESA